MKQQKTITDDIKIKIILNSNSDLKFKKSRFKDLNLRIEEMKEDLYSTHGISFSNITYDLYESFKHDSYKIFINGKEVGKMDLEVHNLLVMPYIEDLNRQNGFKGILTKEPIYEADAFWVNKEQYDKLQYIYDDLLDFYYTIVNIQKLMTTHLGELLKREYL